MASMTQDTPNTKIEGKLDIPPLNGKEISPGIFIIGEPTPMVGTDKLRALANVYGMLGVIELKISFTSSARVH